MTDNRDWFVKSVDGKVYGPAKISKLVEWAKDGRIEPTGFVSVDRDRDVDKPRNLAKSVTVE